MRRTQTQRIGSADNIYFQTKKKTGKSLETKNPSKEGRTGTGSVFTNRAENIKRRETNKNLSQQGNKKITSKTKSSDLTRRAAKINRKRPNQNIFLLFEEVMKFTNKPKCSGKQTKTIH